MLVHLVRPGRHPEPEQHPRAGRDLEDHLVQAPAQVQGALAITEQPFY